MSYRGKMHRAPAPVGTCGKKCFRSIAHARDAHRQAGYRIRIYACPTCTGGGANIFHVTAAEKRRS